MRARRYLAETPENSGVAENRKNILEEKTVENIPVMRKFDIKELHFPVDGYLYDVQVLVSVDGGKSYYYCGNGKFCKTLAEAQAYIESYGA